MIEYLLLIFAIPLGIILAKLTEHEKEIYKKKHYFPLILAVLGAGAVTTYFFNKQVFLTLTFMFLTILSWSKA